MGSKELQLNEQDDNASEILQLLNDQNKVYPEDSAS